MGKRFRQPGPPNPQPPQSPPSPEEFGKIIAIIERELDEFIENLKTQKYKYVYGLLEETIRKNYFDGIILKKLKMYIINSIRNKVIKFISQLKNHQPEDYKNAVNLVLDSNVEGEEVSYRAKIESDFRTVLGILLLSSEDLHKNEEHRKNIEKFLKENCTFSEILNFISYARGAAFTLYFEKKGGKIKESQLINLKIREEWLPVLIEISTEFLSKREEIKKNTKEILRKLKGRIDAYEQELRKKGMKEEEIQERIKPLRELLDEKKLEEVIEKSTPEQLKALSDNLKNTLKLFDEAQKEAEKEGKKIEETGKWKSILEGLNNILQFLAAAGLLWFAFIGILLPLWFIEKAKKEIEPAFKK